jgi:hypothetical protein
VIVATWIVQRTDHDCAICTIAMALGKSYDEVMTAGIETKGFDPERGCFAEYKIIEAFGLKQMKDFRCLHRGGKFGILSAEFFRGIAWGRRAIMAVPSLNIEGGFHSVYWNGVELLDPADPFRKKIYTRWDELLPEEVILFAERTST